MQPKILKARDVESLENTSFATALLGGAAPLYDLPEATPCCPCTACSVGSIIVPDTGDVVHELACGDGVTCTAIYSVDTTAYVTDLIGTRG